MSHIKRSKLQTKLPNVKCLALFKDFGIQNQLKGSWHARVKHGVTFDCSKMDSDTSLWNLLEINDLR